MKIIKQDATYTIKNNSISLPGTDIKQVGDLLANLMLLIPKHTPFGLVSRGPYLQAEEIMAKTISQVVYREEVIISGHSLGAGVGQILALLMKNIFKASSITLCLSGSIKVLGRKARKILANSGVKIVYNVRYRDPIPMLGWWLEPKHETPRTGDKKKHLLDYDMKEHVLYWGG